MCRVQAEYLGDSHESPMSCAAVAASTQACGDFIMWSLSLNSKVGCRCCAPGGEQDATANSAWDLWEVVRFAPPPVVLPSAPPSSALPMPPSVSTAAVAATTAATATAAAAAAAAAAPSPSPRLPSSAPWTLASIGADTRAVTIGLCSFVSLGALLLLCCLGRNRLRKAASRARSKTGPVHEEPAVFAPGDSLSSTRRLRSKKQAGSAVKLLSTASSKRSDACVHADDAPGIALSSMAVAETDQLSRPEQADEAPPPRGRGGLILLPPKAKQLVRAPAPGDAAAPLGQSAGDGVLAGAAGTRAPARTRAFARVDLDLD
jgi:hypothetical protein